MLRTFIDTSNVGDKKWRPPQVDSDWHAFCQAIFQGIEGSEWEAMYYQYKDVHQAVKSNKSNDNKKANVLWDMEEAKDRGTNNCDTNPKKKKTRAQIRLNMWAIHLKSPTAALAKAFEGREQREKVPSVASEW